MKIEGYKALPRESAKHYVKKVCQDLYCVAHVTPAGSFRREKEMLEDIDFVVVPRKGATPDTIWEVASNRFGDPVRGAKKGQQQGKYVFSVGMFGEKLAVDIFLAEHSNYEAMLLFRTGSGKWNTIMRSVAIARGYKLNRYGLFVRGTTVHTGVQTERGIFESLGMRYKAPWERSI